MKAARRGPLIEEERTELSGIVTAMRAVLERELKRVLEGTFGISAGAKLPEDESRLNLDPDQLDQRRELVGLWRALDCRVDLLVRESAFTHTNRLIAIRVAEALELLPESLGRGRRSVGFRQLLEVAPLLGSDDDAGYWQYLQICGDELAHDVPRLFDPRNPLLALRPPPAIVDGLTGLLARDDLGAAGVAGGSAWAAPDTLGWSYQFFNSDEERGEMRRVHPQPVDSWELAVRNQFFTPEYVVGFLVHNSLGRRLVEGGFGGLVDRLEYLVDPPAAAGVAINLADVKVLDPACGSGHFLVGAYDVLERAYALQGTPPAEASSRIVASLWGIDIDARAAQVAAAAIIFRARSNNPRGDLPTPNIVCACAVPGNHDARLQLLASVKPSRRDFLQELIVELDRAPELGSLLRVEDILEGETARLMTFGGGRRNVASPRTRSRGDAPSLADAGIDTGALDVAVMVDDVLRAAQEAADRVTSTPSERVVAADGGDALRLVRALSQRYDAVFMNPPFGEPVPGTKPYLKAAYPWIPTKDYNLFAAFVGRGLELCNPDGYLGAITSRAGMFLTTFERWRNEVLLGNELVVLVDLGHKVMHEALVEAAAYVIRPGKGSRSEPATFIRLLRESPEHRPEALRVVCSRSRGGAADGRLFRVPVDAFAAVPGAPMAYWISPDIRRLFTDFPPLEGHGAEVRVGLQTGDDFRFVRAFWEVEPARFARSRDETFAGKRWVPFAKGGEYSPFWSDIHLVVNYERDGEQLRDFPGSVIRNPQHYFKPGLTWPRRTASGFSPRVLPRGCAFADKGPAIIPSANPLAVLGWVASQTAAAVLAIQLGAADETSSGGASKSYEVGLVAKLPWPTPFEADTRLARLALEITLLRRVADQFDETSREFCAPTQQVTDTAVSIAANRYRVYEDQVLEMLRHSSDLEMEVLEASDSKGAADFVQEEMGVHPSALPRTALPPDANISELIGLPMERLINAASKRRGSIRVLTQKNYFADRRIEILAHMFEVHPEVIISERRRGGVLPPEQIHATAGGLLSYLVGCAFGRWDVRIGRDPTRARPLDDDPFAPVPLCPPGMLVGDDELPGPIPPSDYPLTLHEHRVMIDEPGHTADLTAAVEAAAAVLCDDPRSLVDQALEMLGFADLRTYLDKRFFKDHLGQYSKSRRKAPIYWPLTVGSRSWTVWVYAPTLSREAIYTVVAHADRRLNAATAEVRRLESAQLQASAPGTTTYDPAFARAVAGRLDSERHLSEELRAFHRVVSRVAESGWSPDLDDGIVLCAGPFSEVLLDWPKDLVDASKQIRVGRFPWAAVHKYRESL